MPENNLFMPLMSILDYGDIVYVKASASSFSLVCRTPSIMEHLDLLQVAEPSFAIAPYIL